MFIKKGLVCNMESVNRYYACQKPRTVAHTRPTVTLQPLQGSHNDPQQSILIDQCRVLSSVTCFGTTLHLMC